MPPEPLRMAHLSSVSLENFRTFRRRTTFDMAPLTLITGPNSSGKSSILKALQLLRHNAALGRLHHPTFSGGGHNLGSFEAARSAGSESTSVTLGVSFDWGEFESREFVWVGHDGSDHSSEFEVGDVGAEFRYDDGDSILSAAGIESSDRARYKAPGYQLDWFKVKAGIGEARLMFEVGVESEQASVEVEYVEEVDGRPVPGAMWHEVVSHHYAAVLHGEWFFEDAEEAYEALGFPSSRPQAALEAARWLSGPIRVRLDKPNVYSDTPSIETIVKDACTVQNWTSVDAAGRKVSSPPKNEYFAHGIAELFRPYCLRWTSYVVSALADLDHTGALRGRPQRLYLDDREDSFTRLLYAHTRPGREDRSGNRTSKAADLARLVQDYGIGDDLVVERVADAAYAVRVVQGERQVQLADLGYGYTQLLPLLLYAVHGADAFDPTLLIEEPEANLHPSLQARLADLFVRLTEPRGCRVLAETHSEYLIRRLQYLIAKGEVGPGRVAIYYLGQDAEAKDYVRRITVGEHGRLSEDFGPGFLDEATSLMVALYKYGSEN